MQTVYLPTLNDATADHAALFRLWSQLSGDGLQVRFDFSFCGFLRQNAVAFLGGLARLITHRGGKVEFAWETLEPAVRANLAQNGFMAAFGGAADSWVGNSIPFIEHPRASAHGFADYLAARWLGRGWLGISPGLRDAIIGKMAEIYVNVFEHAKSPIGLFCCGQRFPKLASLELTLVDFGVGIPSNVRLFSGHDPEARPYTAASCMEWAFQTGTSTKPASTPGPRGLGLDLLQSFVRENRGRLEMFSHEGYTLIADGTISHGERPEFFEGTLVNISLRCDETYYCLASELAGDLPF